MQLPSILFLYVVSNTPSAGKDIPRSISIKLEEGIGTYDSVRYIRKIQVVIAFQIAIFVC
jgi:hypothetical protein